MDDETRAALADLEAEARSLRIVTRALAERVQRTEEWIDVVSSPVWRRIGFVLAGWRWRHLGRWRGADRSRWP